MSSLKKPFTEVGRHAAANETGRQTANFALGEPCRLARPESYY